MLILIEGCASKSSKQGSGRHLLPVQQDVLLLLKEWPAADSAGLDEAAQAKWMARP